MVNTANIVHLQWQPAARPEGRGTEEGGCILEVPKPQFPHLHQTVMKITADTLCTTSVTRLLEPRLKAVSGPGLGPRQGKLCTPGGLRTCVHSSHPTGELSQQSCILYLLNYFRKFNTKWKMNANYTSIAQLKLGMLSTGSCSNPGHSSPAYISKDLSLFSRGWQKAH